MFSKFDVLFGYIANTSVCQDVVFKIYFSDFGV